MTVDSDGGVLVAGSAAGVDLKLDFAVARYLVQTNSQRTQERDDP
jgi:hypothetical protein